MADQPARWQRQGQGAQRRRWLARGHRARAWLLRQIPPGRPEEEKVNRPLAVRRREAAASLFS